MVSVFRNKTSAGAFWLAALSVVIHGHFFIVPPEVLTENTNEWLSAFLQPFNTLPDIVLILLYHAIVIVQALRFNVVLNNQRMYPGQSFYTALCYVLLTSIYPAWNNITPALLINFFLLLLFGMLAKLFNAGNAKPLIYNTGLLTGIIVLTYLPSLFLIVTVFFALGMLRSFRLNEWMILLLGLLTPLYFVAGILFLTDDFPKILTYLPHFNLQKFDVAQRLPIIVTAASCALLIITGCYAWQTNIGKMTIQVRRNWNILFIMFLFSIPLIFFMHGAGFVALLLGMLPAAALSANTFVYVKNNLFQTILFWVIIAAIIYNNWWLVY